MPDDNDWWRDEEATEAMADAAREAQFEEELDGHITSIHEWLDEQYRGKYQRGQVELCLEAALACQTEKVPLPTWLIEALGTEIELAVRRPLSWEQLQAAAQAANAERKRIAQRNRDWFWQEGQAVLELNPTIGSEDRLAELISRRAKGTEHEAAARTIRRHIRGILAKRSKHGQAD
jgi:hypothetical protein